LSLKDLIIPDEFKDMFLPLDFQLDMSSTQVRQIGGKAARG